MLRGRRDPEVQKVVDTMHSHWCDGLEHCEQGIAEGTFRSELNPQQTVGFFVFSPLWRHIASEQAYRCSAVSSGGTGCCLKRC